MKKNVMMIIIGRQMNGNIDVGGAVEIKINTTDPFDLSSQKSYRTPQLVWGVKIVLKNRL